MFIVNIIYKKPLEIVDHYLAAHRDFLEEGYQKNYFIVSGPRHPRTGGILISHLKSREQLQAIIEVDPFYIHQVADYDIVEFNPVKYHPQFSYFINN